METFQISLVRKTSAYLLLSPVVALWASTTLLTQWEVGAAAGPPDALPDAPPAALPAPPHSGPLGVEVEARQKLVRPD